jgi:hypothetical protein
MADEDPDDPQLKALRAVWLSMRDNDEDPPDSGVSALMAAARSQAMEMAPAPWWKRMFDQLRRPPMLALASLLVLIGGAVLLTKHDAIEKAPTSPPLYEQGQEKELPHSNLDIGGAPAPATVSPHVVPEPGAAETGATKDKQSTPPPVHRPPAAQTSGGKGMAGTSAPEGTIAPMASPQNDPAFESGDSRPAATASHKSATEIAPSQVLVDQLAAQARRAAKRGDCENAKAIATRIAGQDATYYRDHVAGDLAACVQAPAAADAADKAAR